MTTLDIQLRRGGLAMMVLALILIGAAGSALAAIPSTTDYRNATQPLITGRVLAVSEHDMVVSTEQGNEVPLTLDTRTMVPADLSTDMMVRVEFHFLDDGTRYAKRVIPIRSGQRVTRELAYSHERDDDEAEARYAAASFATAEARPVMRTASATHLRVDRAHETIPNTHEYELATRAMVVGRVVTVTDHRIVIDTDKGQRVPLEMDSRTLIPTDLQSGIGVRVEYRSIDNGDRLATRIVPIRYDRAADQYPQEVAYPEESFDAEPGIDASTAEYQNDATDDGMYVAQATDTETADVDDDGRTLPQTSSGEPLLVLLGLLALGAGAAVMLRRTSSVG